MLDDRFRVLACAMAMTTLLGGCGGGSGGDGGGGGGGGSESTLAVTLRGGNSTEEAAPTARAFQGSDPEDCAVQTSSLPNVNGACLSPDSVSGSVANIHVFRAGGGAPGRLLGGGVGLNQGGLITAQQIDLNNPTALEGEDNIQDDVLGEPWDQLYVYFSHLDLKFQLNGRYWTVRFGFINEPVITDEVVDACIPPESEDPPPEDPDDGGDPFGGYRDEVIANGFLIAGASFRKGDVLFCVKDDDSACAVEEFLWLDTASDTLVATRPAAPRQVSVIADHVTTCAPQHDGPGYSVDLGGYQLNAAVSEPFTLSAEMVEPAPSEEGTDEFVQHVKVYTFSRDGEEPVEGTDMTLYIDFDGNNSVFFPGLSAADLATAEEAAIAEAVFLKSLYIRQNGDDGVPPGMTVSVNATLTGEPPPPALGEDAMPAALR